MEESQKHSIASVIVDLGFNQPLDYQIPPHLQVSTGSQVEVLVRNKVCKGIVAKLKERSQFKKLSSIRKVVGPLLDPDLFKFALWLSNYYSTPLRQVLQTMLPSCVRKDGSHKEQLFVRRLISKARMQKVCADLRQKHPAQAKILEVLLRGKEGMLLSELLEKSGVSKSPITTLEKKQLVALDKVQINRSGLIGEEYFKSEKKKLNPEQKEAFDQISQSIEAKEFHTHLLYGITGSGKTEIYLQLIERVLNEGGSALMLVPEIALTTQMIERFRSRFESKIALFHHRLSDGERFDQWHRIRQNKAQIVIGARSALFTPVQNLRLIIVDEEHEGAYKQEEGFRYHGRDVAVMRGMLCKSTVVLGSATPSLESMYNVKKGKYKLASLSKRVASAKLPEVFLVDMQRERMRTKGPSLFSSLLIEKIQKRLALGEQTILFLNRRGYHTTLVCNQCRHVFKCPSCDLALTFHRGESLLSCHLCDYRLSKPPTSCVDCHTEGTLKYRGIGTEKLEAAVHALFPEARTLRIDSDTTKHKGSLERLFHTFRTQKADILIGTQMVAKGLDFPAVTLVALMHSESGLSIPDFRASEKVFQLITQVAGRAGRGTLAGEVVVQTYLPDNATIKTACNQDYDTFFNEELQVRELFSYPPFSHMVKLTFSGKNGGLLQERACLVRTKLIDLLPKQYLAHPVTPCGYSKIKDNFRFQFLVRGDATAPICHAINQLMASLGKEKEVKMMIDVDPISTFF